MKLVGPKDVTHSWNVDGKTFTAANGVVTPPPLKGEVDQTLFALGFYWEEEAAPRAATVSKS